MAVFAWAPGKDPRGFVAHLTAGAIRFGLEKRGEMLPEMVQAMCRTFQGIPRANVIVQLVGDLVGEPLRRYFSDLPSFAHCASLHIEAALRKRGFSTVDKEMCAAFEDAEGPEVEAGQEPPPRPSACALGDARRFTLVALDLKTGQVIAQSKGTIADVKAVVGEQWLVIEAEYERDKQVLRDRHIFSPLTSASGASADFWTAYYEIMAHPLPLVLMAIAVFGLVAYLIVCMLPAQWGSNLLLALQRTMSPAGQNSRSNGGGRAPGAPSP
eukprot:CAMPEP_0171248366 /NCGR_PEP_ID=MMETSP0790-20130122/48978_1 /TAXON_ID=2925 /ORGANISM="Alexandrium catenella, Strain OF101" /LENGTH=268 /DNA_ID=CAMNT_0011715813 /DNA_START=67 /DNA_END=869 /DNA_ORIENTATION=+